MPPTSALPPVVTHDETTPAVQHDVQHYMRPGVLQFRSLPPLSLYIHIPWCLRKCPYCDFNSHETGSHTIPEQRYLSALIADLESALPLIWGRSVHSIFIGGGTPSLFSPQSIDQLLSDIRARLRLEASCEITLEANPGTFETARFKDYRGAGVTRLSVGVQSFNDAHLQALGRVHDRAQALRALEEAANAFDTFNIDLMYALPGQTMAELDADLQTALSFKPPHLSVYHLTIEPNTYFAKYPPAIPEDDDAYAMLDHLTAITAARGLERYEVSAYARAPHQCAHNRNYWEFGDYLGIGAGAHSKLTFAHRVIRQSRLRDPQRYMQSALSQSAIAQEHEVRRADLAFEYLLNALRLREGFNLQDFSERTALPPSTLAEGLKEGIAREWLTRTGEHIRPTERGFDFLSDLQSLFLSE